MDPVEEGQLSCRMCSWTCGYRVGKAEVSRSSSLHSTTYHRLRVYERSIDLPAFLRWPSAFPISSHCCPAPLSEMASTGCFPKEIEGSLNAGNGRRQCAAVGCTSCNQRSIVQDCAPYQTGMSRDEGDREAQAPGMSKTLQHWPAYRRQLTFHTNIWGTRDVGR